jgi:hypothetical protein
LVCIILSPIGVAVQTDPGHLKSDLNSRIDDINQYLNAYYRLDHDKTHLQSGVEYCETLLDPYTDEGSAYLSLSNMQRFLDSTRDMYDEAIKHPDVKYSPSQWLTDTSKVARAYVRVYRVQKTQSAKEGTRKLLNELSVKILTANRVPFTDAVKEVESCETPISQVPEVLTSDVVTDWFTIIRKQKTAVTKYRMWLLSLSKVVKDGDVLLNIEDVLHKE